MPNVDPISRCSLGPIGARHAFGTNLRIFAGFEQRVMGRIVLLLSARENKEKALAKTAVSVRLCKKVKVQ